MRKTALDTLGATFNGLVYGWAQQKVQMVWHYGKAVQLVSPLISIME